MTDDASALIGAFGSDSAFSNTDSLVVEAVSANEAVCE